jgi:tRNA (guanine-N7-)-methyltransferase
MNFELLTPGNYLPENYWRKLVPSTSRLELEVGCGDGRFLLESALRNPHTLFAGLEMKRSALRRATSGDDLPANAHFFEIDGRWVVSNLLPPTSVDAFHIYFPDPWWKKRHHKRRLFNKDFCRGLTRSIKEDGSVFIITDVQSQYRDMVGALAACGLVARTWQRNHEDSAQSSYERKYRRQGRRLFEARFEFGKV